MGVLPTRQHAKQHPTGQFRQGATGGGVTDEHRKSSGDRADGCVPSGAGFHRGVNQHVNQPSRDANARGNHSIAQPQNGCSSDSAGGGQSNRDGVAHPATGDGPIRGPRHVAVDSAFPNLVGCARTARDQSGSDHQPKPIDQRQRRAAGDQSRCHGRDQNHRDDARFGQLNDVGEDTAIGTRGDTRFRLRVSVQGFGVRVGFLHGNFIIQRAGSIGRGTRAGNSFHPRLGFQHGGRSTRRNRSIRSNTARKRAQVLERSVIEGQTAPGDNLERFAAIRCHDRSGFRMRQKRIKRGGGVATGPAGAMKPPKSTTPSRRAPSQSTHPTRSCCAGDTSQKLKTKPASVGSRS